LKIGQDLKGRQLRNYFGEILQTNDVSQRGIDMSTQGLKNDQLFSEVSPGDTTFGTLSASFRVDSF
jgi:hypothetical protein